jgi:hypothetical protein
LPTEALDQAMEIVLNRGSRFECSRKLVLCQFDLKGGTALKLRDVEIRTYVSKVGGKV